MKKKEIKKMKNVLTNCKKTIFFTLKKKFSVTFFETEPMGTEPGPMIRRQKKRNQKKKNSKICQTTIMNILDLLYNDAVKDSIFHYF